MDAHFALELTDIRLAQVAATLKWLRRELPQDGGALGSALLAVRSAQVVVVREIAGDSIPARDDFLRLVQLPTPTAG
jgi:hypothetical protein